MKQILLKPNELGLVAMLDDEDFDRVKSITWCAQQASATWYAVGNVPNNGSLLLHRIVMNAPNGIVVDHIDHNGLNCQKSNLRFATRSQNSANRRSAKGFRGAYFNKVSKLWVASITCNGTREIIGKYDKLEDALDAYDQRAIELFGEFAMTNKRLAETGANMPNRLVKLWCGREIIVDYQDFARVSKDIWCIYRDDYFGTTVKRFSRAKGDRMKRLANFIMNLPETVFIDHENQNRLDFRRSNLIAREPERLLPRNRTKLGTSGIRGVTQRGEKWYSKIVINGKARHLGSFANKQDAQLAYNRAFVAIHGFAPE